MTVPEFCILNNMKRRLILAAVCLLVVIGLPLVLLVRGSAPSLKNTVQKDTPSAEHPKPEAAEPQSDEPVSYSTKEASSLWVVANKQNPLNPKSYAPSDLVIITGGQYLRAEAAEALARMIATAKAAGLTITAPSAYRSYDTQAYVYNNEVKTNGQAVADSQSARPGYSEHQTGLAVDIAGGGCSITDCFATTAEGKWAAAHAHEHGFILRYPPGKQGITGYRYEPWHFRYVGKQLAAEMKQKGAQTLEEQFGLPAAPNY